MQHVIPELGLAEVIVATKKPATPIRLQAVMAKCIHLHLHLGFVFSSNIRDLYSFIYHIIIHIHNVQNI